MLRRAFRRSILCFALSPPRLRASAVKNVFQTLRLPNSIHPRFQSIQFTTYPLKIFMGRDKKSAQNFLFGRRRSMFQEKFQRNIRFLVLSLSLVCLLAAIGWSQVSTSSITGTVQDSSGAFIAGAKVSAVNEATGVNYETTTTGKGDYTISALPPGNYTINISHQAFRTLTSAHNVLQVGVPLVVNGTLQVGTASEVIQVEATQERIETTNAMISDVVTQKETVTLPLNGRNPLALITLEPGLTQRTTAGAGSGTHVFGSRDRAHNLTIDGIDANESSVPNPQSNIYRLNPDNTQEFRVVTHNATSEFGRNSGANVA